jgi:hypothetical protein
VDPLAASGGLPACPSPPGTTRLAPPLPLADALGRQASVTGDGRVAVLASQQGPPPFRLLDGFRGLVQPPGLGRREALLRRAWHGRGMLMLVRRQQAETPLDSRDDGELACASVALLLALPRARPPPFIAPLFGVSTRRRRICAGS